MRTCATDTAADGRVFTWGHGGHGQLGHGNCDSYSSPKRVEAIQAASFVVHVTGTDDEPTLMRPDGKPAVSAPPKARAPSIGADATAPMGSFGQVLARRKSTKDATYGVSMVACGERHTVFLRVRRAAVRLWPLTCLTCTRVRPAVMRLFARAFVCACASDVQDDGLAVLSCGDNEVSGGKTHARTPHCYLPYLC